MFQNSRRPAKFKKEVESQLMLINVPGQNERERAKTGRRGKKIVLHLEAIWPL